MRQPEGKKQLCRLVLSPTGPALLIDLNKKLNYSILATGGRESKQQRETERSMGGEEKQQEE